MPCENLGTKKIQHYQSVMLKMAGKPTPIKKMAGNCDQGLS